MSDSTYLRYPVGVKLVLAAACLLLSACGAKIETPEPEGPVFVFGDGKDKASGLAPQGAPGMAPDTPPAEALPEQATAKLPHEGFTPEEEIEFTNPDDPDSSLPALSSILADPSKRRGPWEKSLQSARRIAAREGKPVLVWFTDSARSPKCKALDEELFSNAKFQQWASEHLIRLKIDESASIDDPDLSIGERETMRVNLKNHVRALKKQYKILGYPSMILLGPGEEVIGRYRGYDRGEADFTWGLIRQGVAVAADSYRVWRSGLERKGYREWHDRKGRSVFAKLVNYHEGSLILIEPDGTRSRTHERELCEDDRQWLEQQKQLRQRR